MGWDGEERRASTRMALGLTCEYVITERTGEEGVTFHQGVGKVLNVSPEGMLVFLGIQPRVEQIIEISLSHPKTGHTLSQIQMLWSQPADDGKNYMVGCKFLSGPYSSSQARTCAPTELVSP